MTGGVFLTPSTTNDGLPFPKHSRLARLDTLGFDAPCFGYTLDKLTHRVNLSSFTLKDGGSQKNTYHVSQIYILLLYIVYELYGDK